MNASVSTLFAQGRPSYSSEYEQTVLGHLKTMRSSQGANMHNVPVEDGRLLRLLARSVNAQRVLEIGTSNGYSAIWLGLGMAETGGGLTTIEIDETRYRMAVENFRNVNMDDIIHAVHGDALKVMQTLEGPYDMVFVDVPQIAKEIYPLILPKLKPGGIILSHAVCFESRFIQDFVDWLSAHRELDTIILPLTRAGISLSYKKKPGL